MSQEDYVFQILLCLRTSTNALPVLWQYYFLPGQQQHSLLPLVPLQAIHHTTEYRAKFSTLTLDDATSLSKSLIASQCT